jgi:hypothetical protein
MHDLSQFWSTEPFSLTKQDKQRLLLARSVELTQWHYQRCTPYARLLDGMKVDPDCPAHALEDLPFLPVRLFKIFDLLSTSSSENVRTMTSSGTSGNVSKIFLDRETAANQVKALARITRQFLGAKRLPMLIIDSASVLKDRRTFSARGAGIVGFSMFGSDVTYALDERMDLNFPEIERFLTVHAGSPILIFGFTSIVWQHLYVTLRRERRRIDLSNAILFHGGGWKKLEAMAVDNEQFKSELRDVCGIRRFHNYYGMVEQTGSIFVEGECGHLHSSIFSDVLFRRTDFSLCAPGESGLIELVSALPQSYPGHVLLTEDVGELLGEDDCRCGLLGKYFRVHGRAKDAELRGCSDTY